MFHKGFYQPVLAMIIISMMIIVFSNLYQYSISIQQGLASTGRIYERPVLFTATTCSGDYYLTGLDLSSEGIKIKNGSTENMHNIYVHFMNSDGDDEQLYWNNGATATYDALPELIAGDTMCFYGTLTVNAYGSFYISAAEGGSRIDVPD